MISVADLHCDLLCYLARNHARTAMNPESRCSLPQLEQGGVECQILAAYTDTKPGSVADCSRQIEIFSSLPELYPKRFVHLSKEDFVQGKKTKEGISIASAIENCSGLLEEDEDLALFFSRFDMIFEKAAPLLYASLTWNGENRFGGGSDSKKGLSTEGARVLEYMSGKRVAIDLSHASDRLAHDIINTIDKKGLSLIPIASHSNFRAVTNQKRNLPDEFVKEIIRRGGVIGLNFVRVFIGITESSDFIRQVEHARSLGALDHFCFGADFFYSDDFSSRLNEFLPFYFSKYSNASCYPQLLHYFQNSLSESEIIKLAHQNVRSFIGRLCRLQEI